MREALGSIPSVSTFMSYSRQGTPGSARAGSRSPGVGSQILLEGEGERWSEGDNAGEGARGGEGERWSEGDNAA